MEYWQKTVRCNEYLQTVKAGDKVYVVSGSRVDHVNTLTVTKVTKTQIVVDRGFGVERYRKDDGRILGEHHFGSPHLIDPEWAKEKLEYSNAEMETRTLQRKLSDVSWRSFGIADRDLLRKALELINGVIAERDARHNA